METLREYGRRAVEKANAKPAPSRVELSEAHMLEGSALWHVHKSIGRIRTKASTGKHAGGEHDGRDYLPRELQAQIGTSDPNAPGPDEALDTLINRGVLPEGSSTSDLYDRLARDYEDYRGSRDQSKQDETFAKHARGRTAKDAVEIDTATLEPGDTFEFGPPGKEEDFEVQDGYHPNGIVVKDGPKYGTQVIDPNRLKSLKVKRTEAASQIASREAPEYAYAGADYDDDWNPATPF